MPVNKEAVQILQLRSLLKRLHRVCKFKKIRDKFCLNSAESGICKHCEYGLRRKF